jgi:putative FmdB family regulatory protein
MPIYEYRCPNCGVFDVMQKITEQPLKKCPRCKKAKVSKLISNTAFQLKGSGWYVTDYANKGRNGAATDKSSDSSSSGDSSSDSSSSDGKGSDSKASDASTSPPPAKKSSGKATSSSSSSIAA